MARSLNPSAAETIYHDGVWTDARGYATVRLPAEAGPLEQPLELEQHPAFSPDGRAQTNTD